MKVIPDKTSLTLENLIKEHIECGTTVHTDQFSSYISFFSDNTDYNYGNVNHKYNFVDPITGVHTQNIENLWSQFKKFKRKKSYSKLKYLQLYLDEFKVRKEYDNLSRWRFFELLFYICF